MGVVIMMVSWVIFFLLFAHYMARNDPFGKPPPSNGPTLGQRIEEGMMDRPRHKQEWFEGELDAIVGDD